jgi:hypothetical protein
LLLGSYIALQGARSLLGGTVGDPGKDIQFAWDPNPAEQNVTSYNLYVGDESRNYGEPYAITEGTTLETNIESGTKYIAVTAVNENGESDFSDELVLIVQDSNHIPRKASADQYALWQVEDGLLELINGRVDVQANPNAENRVIMDIPINAYGLDSWEERVLLLPIKNQGERFMDVSVVDYDGNVGKYTADMNLEENNQLILSLNDYSQADPGYNPANPKTIRLEFEAYASLDNQVSIGDIVLDKANKIVTGNFDGTVNAVPENFSAYLGDDNVTDFKALADRRNRSKRYAEYSADLSLDPIDLADLTEKELQYMIPNITDAQYDQIPDGSAIEVTLNGMNNGQPFSALFALPKYSLQTGFNEGRLSVEDPISANNYDAAQGTIEEIILHIPHKSRFSSRTEYPKLDGAYVGVR